MWIESDDPPREIKRENEKKEVDSASRLRARREKHVYHGRNDIRTTCRSSRNCRQLPLLAERDTRRTSLLSPPLFLVTRSTPAPPRSRVLFLPLPPPSPPPSTPTPRRATLRRSLLRLFGFYSNYSLSPSLAFDGYFSVLTRGYFSVRTLDTGPRTPDQRPSVRTLRIRARGECKVRKRKSKQSKYWFFVLFVLAISLTFKNGSLECREHYYNVINLFVASTE